MNYDDTLNRMRYRIREEVRRLLASDLFEVEIRDVGEGKLSLILLEGGLSGPEVAAMGLTREAVASLENVPASALDVGCVHYAVLLHAMLLQMRAGNLPRD